MSDWFDALRESLGDLVLDAHSHRGDDTILVPAAEVHGVMRSLRDAHRFNFLMDVTAVDYLDRDPRFEVVYHLAAIDIEPRGTDPTPGGPRLRVKAGVAANACAIASVCDLWPAANWMEREVYDLYGVRFTGHPDLRRILLYDGFEGHPLRKDYPKERRQPLVGPRN